MEHPESPKVMAPFLHLIPSLATSGASVVLDSGNFATQFSCRKVIFLDGENIIEQHWGMFCPPWGTPGCRILDQQGGHPELTCSSWESSHFFGACSSQEMRGTFHGEAGTWWASRGEHGFDRDRRREAQRR